MSDRHSQLQQAALHLLHQHAQSFFRSLSDCQLSRALPALLHPFRAEESLSRHAKVWEELLHPFKLLVECERRYHEWTFLPNADGSGGDTSGRRGGGGGAGGSGSSSSSSSGSTSLFSSMRKKLIGSSSSSSGSGSSNNSSGENSLRHLYNQIPLSLKKTQTFLHKLMASSQSGGGGHNNNSHVQPQHGSSLQPPSSGTQTGFTSSVSVAVESFVSSSSFFSRSPSVLALPLSPVPTDFHPSLSLLIEELISSFIPARVALIHVYQTLHACFSPFTPRPKRADYVALGKACERIRTQVERGFTHPYLTPLARHLLLPELVMLQCLCALEQDAEGTLVGRFDWQDTMITLMRIKHEQTQWINHILARDREGSSSATASSSSASSNAAGTGSGSSKKASGLFSSSLLGGGSNGSVNGAQANVSPTMHCTPTLTLPPLSSALVPTVLHWIQHLHHSLLCKSTLIFWHATASHSIQIKGYALEMQHKLDRLEFNYVSLLDKLVSRTPNCYSVALLMDATGMEAPHEIDPFNPLIIQDSAVHDPETGEPLSPSFGPSHSQSEEEEESDREHAADAHGPRSGGLAHYPFLFSWPASRPPLEKWNLVSLLQQKQHLMSSMESLPLQPAAGPHPAGGPSHAHASHQAGGWSLPIAKQTNTYCLAVGPSNHPSDLCIWDYESEYTQMQSLQQAGPTSSLPPTSVSYFLCKLDVHQEVYLVLTFQTQLGPAAPAVGSGAESSTVPSSGEVSRASTGSDSQGQTHNANAGGNLPNSLSFSSQAAASNTPSSASSAATSASFLSPAARKRVFDQLMAELAPILRALRHMHVFQHMQPHLGKKKT